MKNGRKRTRSCGEQKSGLEAAFLIGFNVLKVCNYRDGAEVMLVVLMQLFL